MKYSKALALGGSGAAILLSAATAMSAPKKANVCSPGASAYKSAVAAVKEGHLREARAQLLICAESKCGGLSLKCKAGYEKLGAAMPSIIPVVIDETGAARADVEVKIDGEILTSRLNGMALPVEAGVHELSFSMDGSIFDTQKLMIVESDRDHIVNATRQGPAAPKTSGDPATKAAPGKPSTTSSSSDSPSLSEASADSSSSDKASAEKPSSAEASDRSSGGAHALASSQAPAVEGRWALPHSPWPYVIGGVGVAAVAAGGLLTYWGNKDNTTLQNQCAPNCSPSDRDHVKAMYVASDVSFGVGVAALGVTTWLFASSRTAERAPAPSTAVLSVTPTRSGAFASVSGAF